MKRIISIVLVITHVQLLLINYRIPLAYAQTPQDTQLLHTTNTTQHTQESFSQEQERIQELQSIKEELSSAVIGAKAGIQNEQESPKVDPRIREEDKTSAVIGANAGIQNQQESYEVDSCVEEDDKEANTQEIVRDEQGRITRVRTEQAFYSYTYQSNPLEEEYVRVELKEYIMNNSKRLFLAELDETQEYPEELKDQVRIAVYGPHGEIQYRQTVEGKKVYYRQGMVDCVVDAQGVVSEYDYVIDQSTGEVCGTEVVREGVRRVYDKAGQLKEVVVKGAHYTYDQGQLQEVVTAEGRKYQYGVKEDGTQFGEFIFSGQNTIPQACPFALQLQYQQHGVLDYVKYSDGSVQEYDEQGRIKVLRRGDGTVLEYEYCYDQQNQLVQIIGRCENEEVIYSAQAELLMRKVWDQGHCTRVEYSQNRIKYMFRDNAQYEFFTESDGCVCAVLMESSQSQSPEVITKIVYDTQQRVRIIEYADGAKEEYSLEGNLEKRIEKKGDTQTYTYKKKAQGTLQYIVVSAGNTQAYYREDGRLLYVLAPSMYRANQQMKIVYDSKRRIRSIQDAGEVYRYRYYQNSQGTEELEIKQLNSGRIQWYQQGRLIKEQDTKDNFYEYEYNQEGKVLQVVVTNQGVVKNRYQATYDAQENVHIQDMTNTTRIYNAQGKLLKTIFANGQIYCSEYTDTQIMLSRKIPESGDDGLLHVDQYYFNEYWQLEKAVLSDASIVYYDITTSEITKHVDKEGNLLSHNDYQQDTQYQRRYADVLRKQLQEKVSQSVDELIASYQNLINTITENRATLAQEVSAQYQKLDQEMAKIYEECRKARESSFGLGSRQIDDQIEAIQEQERKVRKQIADQYLRAHQDLEYQISQAQQQLYEQSIQLYHYAQDELVELQINELLPRIYQSYETLLGRVASETEARALAKQVIGRQMLKELLTNDQGLKTNACAQTHPEKIDEKLLRSVIEAGSYYHKSKSDANERILYHSTPAKEYQQELLAKYPDIDPSYLKKAMFDPLENESTVVVNYNGQGQLSTIHLSETSDMVQPYHINAMKTRIQYTANEEVLSLHGAQGIDYKSEEYLGRSRNALSFFTSDEGLQCKFSQGTLTTLKGFDAQGHDFRMYQIQTDQNTGEITGGEYYLTHEGTSYVLYYEKGILIKKKENGKITDVTGYCPTLQELIPYRICEPALNTTLGASVISQFDYSTKNAQVTHLKTLDGREYTYHGAILHQLQTLMQRGSTGNEFEYLMSPVYAFLHIQYYLEDDITSTLSKLQALTPLMSTFSSQSAQQCLSERKNYDQSRSDIRKIIQEYNQTFIEQLQTSTRLSSSQQRMLLEKMSSFCEQVGEVVFGEEQNQLDQRIQNYLKDLQIHIDNRRGEQAYQTYTRLHLFLCTYAKDLDAKILIIDQTLTKEQITSGSSIQINAPPIDSQQRMQCYEQDIDQLLCAHPETHHQQQRKQILLTTLSYQYKLLKNIPINGLSNDAQQRERAALIQQYHLTESEITSYSEKQFSHIISYLNIVDNELARCAVGSLYQLLRSHNVQLSQEIVQEQLLCYEIWHNNLDTSNKKLTISMKALQSIAAHYGVILRGYKLSKDCDIPSDSISLVHNQHYIYIQDHPSESPQYFDPSLGESGVSVQVSSSEFQAMNHAYILTTHCLQDIQELSEEDLCMVRGRGWLDTLKKFFKK